MSRQSRRCPSRRRRRSLVVPHSLQRPLQVLARQQPLQQSLAPCRSVPAAASGFVAPRACTGFTLPSPCRSGCRASDAWPRHIDMASTHSSLVRPFVPGRLHRLPLLRPLLTSRSGSTPSPFQAQGEISPGKNAVLRRTTAGFTPPPLGHGASRFLCPLALLGTASYPVPVHRPAVSLPASSPRSVALPQLRFASLAVTSFGGTCTRKTAPMLGAPKKRRGRSPAAV